MRGAPPGTLLVLVGALSALPGCRSVSNDPLCAGHNAADYAPNEARFRAMSPAERREDAARFNDLARRCGWEP